MPPIPDRMLSTALPPPDSNPVDSDHQETHAEAETAGRPDSDGSSRNLDSPPAEYRKLKFLPPSSCSPLSRGTSAAATSAVHTEDTAHGSSIKYERAAQPRTAALRYLSPAPPPRHPQSKTVETGDLTISHPVTVRTYSGDSRQDLGARISVGDGETAMDKVDLPSVEAFSFDGIMSSIDPEVSGTLDAIAGICASSKYSLSNQYDVHLPPQATTNIDASLGREEEEDQSTSVMGQPNMSTYRYSRAHMASADRISEESEITSQQPTSPIALCTGIVSSRQPRASTPHYAEFSGLPTTHASEVIVESNAVTLRASNERDYPPGAGTSQPGHVDTNEQVRQTSVLDNITSWLSRRDQTGPGGHRAEEIASDVRRKDPSAKDSLKVLLSAK
ncbi:MAG: hypothetical protein M1833_001871 [Piccolia ochrophora]|nr:MAG: hypothetical protein M1833_001871 [Piccolia ochrophora]